MSSTDHRSKRSKSKSKFPFNVKQDPPPAHSRTRSRSKPKSKTPKQQSTKTPKSSQKKNGTNSKSKAKSKSKTNQPKASPRPSKAPTKSTSSSRARRRASESKAKPTKKAAATTPRKSKKSANSKGSKGSKSSKGTKGTKGSKTNKAPKNLKSPKQPKQPKQAKTLQTKSKVGKIEKPSKSNKLTSQGARGSGATSLAQSLTSPTLVSPNSESAVRRQGRIAKQGSPRRSQPKMHTNAKMEARRAYNQRRYSNSGLTSAGISGTASKDETCILKVKDIKNKKNNSEDDTKKVRFGVRHEARKRSSLPNINTSKLMREINLKIFSPGPEDMDQDDAHTSERRDNNNDEIGVKQDMNGFVRKRSKSVKISKKTVKNANKDMDAKSDQKKKRKKKQKKKENALELEQNHSRRRSSMPSINVELVKKAKVGRKRNIAGSGCLSATPKVRSKSITLTKREKKLEKERRNKNFGFGGLVIHVGHRYRLDDGKIGICRFKGRTMFGQSAHDWIGLVLEVGKGEHNGTVKGRAYFKCRDGTGIMVRPERIVQDMGADTKELTDKMINDAKGKKLMQQALLLQQQQKMTLQVKSREKKAKSHDWGNDWKPPSYVNDIDDHSIEIFAPKLHHSKRLLDKHKGEKAEKKLLVSEI